MTSQTDTKKCNLCQLESNTTDDVIAFGDWMQRHDLLSTNLPQLGSDTNGILGFLLRDIRVEIRNATLRQCIYCGEKGASIACHTCKKYFHQLCGHRFRCLFQFVGEFRSYCDECFPMDEQRLRWKQTPAGANDCYICLCPMGMYRQDTWIYAPCCNNGVVHVDCMRKYALSAGYYLVCIWCRSKKFRDLVRLQGVFVPDRDAQWESKNAYADLHRGHRRCNMEICKCPKGRDYIGGAWTLIVCSLCGSFGTHNPRCIPGCDRQTQKVQSFTCEICLNTTQSFCNVTAQKDSHAANELMLKYKINLDLQMVKMPLTDFSEQPIRLTPQFSDDETSSIATTVTTVYELRKTQKQFDNLSLNPQSAIETEMNQDFPTATEVENAPIESTPVLDLCSSSESICTSECLETMDPNKLHTQECTEKCVVANEDVLAIANGMSSLDLTHTDDVDVAKRIVVIKGWPELNNEWNVISTCTVKIDLNSPRFKGKTVEDICSKFMTLIKDEDKVDRCTQDIGIWSRVDEIITESQKSIGNNDQLKEFSNHTSASEATMDRRIW